jgi:hypothetical protein
MVIVSVTRDGLRDEFAMADEVFALSPISARASLPSEEDYDAIREAFMETSRGRWFLGEYAKRNRNADTRMVLDAVERIEETLAAQRQPPPVPDNGLAEALAAIRGALGEARAAAASAIDGLDLEQNLAPVRKGARVIREIAWRLREIGADSRICDLIDSQVGAIEAACGEISSTGARDALSAAFGLIEGRIEEFDEPDAAAPAPKPTAEAAQSPSLTQSDEVPAGAADTVEEFQAANATNDIEVAMSLSAMPVESTAAKDEAADVTVEAVAVTDQPADVTTEATHMTAEAAYDEAVLDLVALEMAAPDPFDDDEFSEIEIDEIHRAEPPPADPEITAVGRKPLAARAQSAAVQASKRPSLEPVLEESPEPSREPSLGSTILATGIVQRPRASAPDPLAPIRRMSQAEKIAFFS